MYYLGGRLGFAPWRSVTTFDATLRPSDHQDILKSYYAKNPSLASRAARRRKYFDNAEQYRSLLDRPNAFGSFEPRMLKAHCSSTIRPRRDGAAGLELSCPPEIEVATYEAVTRSTAPYDFLTNFSVKTHMIGADPNAPGGTWIGQLHPVFVRRLPYARYTKMHGHGHLMPFECPEACAEIVLEMLN